MKILYILPFVRHNVMVTALCKERPIESVGEAILIASAGVVELAMPPLGDSKVRIADAFDVKQRGFVDAESDLEVILESVRACDADLGDTETVINALLAAGWKFYKHPKQTYDIADWRARFAEAVPGVPGMSAEVRSRLLTSLEGLSVVMAGGKGKKGKKGKKKGKD